MPPDLAAIRRATLIGGTAVLMWATLALLATWSRAIPPFQLTGMAFAVAFLIGLGWMALQGRSPLAAARQRPAVWLLGVGGLFGYHLVFFMALRLAPPVEANLINYAWPLLIVLFSALLPGERLRWWHIAGAALGLLGVVVLIGGRGVVFDPRFALGYGAAMLSAMIWAGYSVLSRRIGAVPTETVGWFCGGTALLSLLCHLALEETVAPDAAGWAAVAGLGLGPVGLAFFVWDHGVKRGDIRALGAFAYAAPLLSTLLLIAFGEGMLTPAVGAACALIVGGAVLAGRDLWARRGAAAA
ncbi:DMT family transporter [Inquilinus limosus]|uniref:aromatic amino acid exporter YddG n=1 Tax=Inquilinus limosus TaxID=171674 RepID=UPI0004174687|nr:EamA family transporter [Inquilinus limosus]